MRECVLSRNSRVIEPTKMAPDSACWCSGAGACWMTRILRAFLIFASRMQKGSPLFYMQARSLASGIACPAKASCGGSCRPKEGAIVARSEFQCHDFNFPLQLGTGSSDMPEHAQVLVSGTAQTSGAATPVPLASRAHAGACEPRKNDNRSCR